MLLLLSAWQVLRSVRNVIASNTHRTVAPTVREEGYLRHCSVAHCKAEATHEFGRPCDKISSVYKGRTARAQGNEASGCFEG
jgi:hypothetical protein